MIPSRCSVFFESFLYSEESHNIPNHISEKSQFLEWHKIGKSIQLMIYLDSSADSSRNWCGAIGIYRERQTEAISPCFDQHYLPSEKARPQKGSRIVSPLLPQFSGANKHVIQKNSWICWMWCFCFFNGWYCWWKKSCTSWYVVNPINYKVYVSQVVQDFFHQQWHGKSFWVFCNCLKQI